MKAYFSQFGDVSRLRLARNKKVSRRCIPDEILPLFTEINLNPQSSLPSYVSDRSIETFRLYRDAQQVGRRDHGRDDAQLLVDGPYPSMSREFESSHTRAGVWDIEKLIQEDIVVRPSGHP